MPLAFVQAAQHFAKAVTMIGITVLLALLTRGAGRGLSRGLPRVSDTPPQPTGRFRLLCRPKITRSPNLPAGEGATSFYGDIQISTRGTATDQALALFHEKVHSFLTPRLIPLRDLRVDLRAYGYTRSALLRYLEEALAET